MSFLSFNKIIVFLGRPVPIVVLMNDAYGKGEGEDKLNPTPNPYITLKPYL
jgi:hypothetical protein